MKQPLSRSSVLVLSSDVASADLGESLALLGLSTKTYYTVEGVGPRIFARLSEPTSVASICDSLLASFAVDRERCERDVLDFLERLRAEGLVVTVPDNPA